jgi:DNA polymerase-3 subunit gamma/tau
MVEHLRHICAQEGLTTEPGVLELIARQSTGSMRDALTLLDQMMSYTEGVLTLEQVQDVLGARGAGEIAACVDRLIARDLPGGLTALHAALEHGADLRQFNRQVVEHLRTLLLLRAGGDPALLEASADELTALRAQAERTNLADLSAWLRVFTAAEANLKNAVYGALPLEMALVEASLAGTAATERGPRPAAEVAPSLTPTRPAEAREAPPRIPPQREPVPARPPAVPPTASAPPAAPPPLSAASPPAASSATNGNHAADSALDMATVIRAWDQVVALLNSQQGGRNLAAILRDMSQAWPLSVKGTTIAIGVASDFFRSRLDEMRNRSTIEEAFSQVLGQRVLIHGEVRSTDTRPSRAEVTEPVAPPASLGARANKARAIFDEEDDPGAAS